VDQKVHSAAEIDARVHIYTDRYLHDVEIEAELLTRCVDTLVVPAVSEYLGLLCRSVADTKAIGKDAPHSARAGELSSLFGELLAERDALVALRTDIQSAAKSSMEKATRYANELIASMARARSAADRLELLCGDGHWPLPNYQEMLFVR
jgi:glutamine synthetase